MKQAKKRTDWWKEVVVYQIYPRSFMDSNGDGIGDLRGIISRLGYIRSLGVDVIWLSPIYASPNDDNGYDISDYRAIMKECGTMEDFDELLREVHNCGMKLVLDLVVNHTSDEHPWFVEARKSRENPHYEYYHWWPLEKGRPAYRPSYFEENAWRYNPRTRSWYLHYFSRKQPDLNWENPGVRHAIYDMMRFWLDKGIDGFRMDSIPLIAKDTAFPPIDRRKYPDVFSYYAHGPHLHDYLHEMYTEVLSKYDIMTVGEGSALGYRDVAGFVEPERQELDMLYGFGPSEVRNNTVPDAPDSGIPYSLLALKKMFGDWDKAVGNGWPAIYMGNHDQPRMISRFGSDLPEFREVSARMLITFLLTMRGTPYWYAGDEIGMVNAGFNHIGDYRDVAVLNQYKSFRKHRKDMTGFMEQQKQISRDNARTPMQWDDTPNAGFSSVTPWLKVNAGYRKVNVVVEEKNPDSVLNYFRKMIAFRKANPELIFGTWKPVDRKNSKVFAYIRDGGERKFLVILNFSCREASCRPGICLTGAEALLDNYNDCPPLGKEIRLRPFEALVLIL